MEPAAEPDTAGDSLRRAVSAFNNAWQGVSPPEIPTAGITEADGANVLGGTHCHPSILNRIQYAYGTAFREPPVAVLDSQPEKYRDAAVRHAVPLTVAPLLGIIDEDFVDLWHLLTARPSAATARSDSMH